MNATTEGAELRAALARLTGQENPDSKIAAFLAHGITAAQVADVGRLAEHAAAVDTAYPNSALAQPGQVRELTRWMVWRLDTFVEDHVEVEVAMQWLTVLASDTDGDRVEHFYAHRVSIFADWKGVPDAPLVYAAGLTPAEAHAQHTAGTLHPDALRALAGLRGYRLPTDGLTTPG